MTNGETLDDATVKPWHGVRWLENRGPFPFEPHDLAALPGAHRAVAADLDGDGDLDVAVAAFLPDPDRTRGSLASLGWLERKAPGVFERHTLQAGQLSHFDARRRRRGRRRRRRPRHRELRRLHLRAHRHRFPRGRLGGAVGDRLAGSGCGAGAVVPGSDVFPSSSPQRGADAAEEPALALALQSPDRLRARAESAVRPSGGTRPRAACASAGGRAPPPRPARAAATPPPCARAPRSPRRARTSPRRPRAAAAPPARGRAAPPPAAHPRAAGRRGRGSTRSGSGRPRAPRGTPPSPPGSRSASRPSGTGRSGSSRAAPSAFASSAWRISGIALSHPRPCAYIIARKTCASAESSRSTRSIAACASRHGPRRAAPSRAGTTPRGPARRGRRAAAGSRSRARSAPGGTGSRRGAGRRLVLRLRGEDLPASPAASVRRPAL